MGPILQARKTWKTESFLLEEVCDEQGHYTYYLDNICLSQQFTDSRMNNIINVKKHLQSICDFLQKTAEEEIINNLDLQEK